MVLVFYLLCIILMMLIRPILNVNYLKNGKDAVYSALYFIPILALFHTVVGGLICMLPVSFDSYSNTHAQLFYGHFQIMRSLT